jgi:hypothetical protein
MTAATPNDDPAPAPTSPESASLKTVLCPCCRARAFRDFAGTWRCRATKLPINDEELAE